MQLLVNIDVDDLDRAIAFYSTAFGLTCARRLFDGTVAELVGSSSRIYLLSKPDGSSAASPFTNERRHYARHWTPLHLDFEVPDIEAAVSRAVSAGATLERDVKSLAWGKHAELSDPFGHGFCFVQFTTEGYAAVA